MKETRLLMGMPITVEIVHGNEVFVQAVFDYFQYIDEIFSTYKTTSEISRLNRGELTEKNISGEVKKVLQLCRKTKEETHGYFYIGEKGSLDPSGLVKGWAIHQISLDLWKKGVHNFFIDAGGDIQVSGKNDQNKIWNVGIKNPFDQEKIVKVMVLENKGVATSGTYIRGSHIIDPVTHKKLDEVVSLTVIGPNVYEADRFATAAFAMGEKGITFIEQMKDLEGYQIDKSGTATYTSGFDGYTV